MRAVVQSTGVGAVIPAPPTPPDPTPGGGSTGTADYTRAPIGPNRSNGGYLLSQSEIEFMVTNKFRGPVILNGWDFNGRDQLNKAGILTVFYMDITSVRDDVVDNVGGNGPAAYSYNEANGHDDWFLHKNGGRYKQAGYNAQYWMNVPGLNRGAVSQGWQNAWIARAKSRTIGTPWAGIMCDNDMPDVSPYYAFLGNDEGTNLTDLKNGTLRMLQGAGVPMQAAGKLLIPNIGEPWIGDQSRWSTHSTAGGGAWLEMFTGWSTNDNGDYHDQSVIKQQVDLIAQTGSDGGAGTGVAIYRCPGTGRKRVLFGYAAFLCGGGSSYGAYFSGDDQYTMHPNRWWQAEMGMLIGAPIGTTYTTTSTWGLSRLHTNGWAACNVANEGSSSITFTVPSGMLLPNGSAAPGSVTLAPHNGVVYKSTTPVTPPTISTAPLVTNAVAGSGAGLRTVSSSTRLKLKGVAVWGIKDFVANNSGFAQGQYDNRTAICAQIANWGANVIRLRVLADEYNKLTNMGSQATYLQWVKDWVVAAKNVGLYTQICWWDSLDSSDSTKNNGNWASQYSYAFPMMTAVHNALLAQNSGTAPAGVFYEPFNEPNNVTWDQWYAAMTATISLWRTTNHYQGVLVIDTPNWSHDYDNGYMGNLETYDAARTSSGKHNLVFARHDYHNDYASSTYSNAAWQSATGGSSTAHVILESEFGNYNGGFGTNTTWSAAITTDFKTHLFDRANIAGAQAFVFGNWVDADAMSSDAIGASANTWGADVKNWLAG